MLTLGSFQMKARFNATRRQKEILDANISEVKNLIEQENAVRKATVQLFLFLVVWPLQPFW